MNYYCMYFLLVAKCMIVLKLTNPINMSAIEKSSTMDPVKMHATNRNDE